MPAVIKRITAIPVRVPIPFERVNCPEFSHEMLHRGAPGNEWGGNTFLGDVPFLVIKVEGDGGPAGWSDSFRYSVESEVEECARPFIGKAESELFAEAENLGIDIRSSARLTKGVQTAVLDWMSLVRDVPLWSLFGEKVRDSVKVEYWSGHRTPAGAARLASEAIEKGFSGLKLKGNPKLDVEGIAHAIVAAAGREFPLNIDPNGRWDDLEFAVEKANDMMSAGGNVLLEDPSYDTEVTTEVRRRTGIATACTVRSPESVYTLKQSDGAAAFNLIGHWSSMLKTARAIDETGIPYWLGSGVESGLADLASAHFAATRPGCTMGSDLVANMVRSDDLVVDPIEFRNGHLVIPDGPGRGNVTDEDAIERHRVGEPVVIE